MKAHMVGKKHLKNMKKFMSTATPNTNTAAKKNTNSTSSSKKMHEKTPPIPCSPMVLVSPWKTTTNNSSSNKVPSPDALTPGSNTSSNTDGGGEWISSEKKKKRTSSGLGAALARSEYRDRPTNGGAQNNLYIGQPSLKQNSAPCYLNGSSESSTVGRSINSNPIRIPRTRSSSSAGKSSSYQSRNIMSTPQSNNRGTKVSLFDLVSSAGGSGGKKLSPPSKSPPAWASGGFSSGQSNNTYGSPDGSEIKRRGSLSEIMAAEEEERNQRATKHVDGHVTKWYQEDRKYRNFDDIQKDEAKSASLLATEKLIREIQIEEATAAAAFKNRQQQEQQKRSAKKKKRRSSGASRQNVGGCVNGASNSNSTGKNKVQGNRRVRRGSDSIKRNM
jgi:hypothetical protein